VIRVVIADDQALVRGGFRMILDAQPDVEVVGEAADGEEALKVARAERPGVVLMDIRMPRMDGLAATRALLADPQPPKIVVLTTFDSDEYVYDAMRLGASGFLLKTVRPEDLAEAVRTVARGETLLAPDITRRLVERFVAAPLPGGKPELLGELTEREIDVLRELGRGRSNGEIATTLFVSEATVKTHVSHVLQKLGLRDRAQAVVAAYESGLVVPGGSDLTSA
jgi:DNA-binding NarL/FixJ family response regulator